MAPRCRRESEEWLLRLRLVGTGTGGGSYAYMARGGKDQNWIPVSPAGRVVIVRFAAESADATERYSWRDIFQMIAGTPTTASGGVR